MGTLTWKWCSRVACCALGCLAVSVGQELCPRWGGVDKMGVAQRAAQWTCRVPMVSLVSGWQRPASLLSCPFVADVPETRGPDSLFNPWRCHPQPSDTLVARGGASQHCAQIPPAASSYLQVTAASALQGWGCPHVPVSPVCSDIRPRRCHPCMRQMGLTCSSGRCGVTEHMWRRAVTQMDRPLASSLSGGDVASPGTSATSSVCFCQPGCPHTPCAPGSTSGLLQAGGSSGSAYWARRSRTGRCDLRISSLEGICNPQPCSGNRLSLQCPTSAGRKPPSASGSPVTHLEAAAPSNQTCPTALEAPHSRQGLQEGSHPPSGPWQVLQSVTRSAPGFLNCFLPGHCCGEKVSGPDTCLRRAAPSPMAACPGAAPA